MGINRRVLVLGSAMLAVAGATSIATVAAAGSEPAHTIHVIRRDAHTGIALPAARLPAGVWPAQTDLPQARFYEVGWGDREYYRATDPGFWLGLKALLGNRPGVLHVVALEGPIEAVFGTTVGPLDIVEIALSAAGFERLVALIARSHERDAAGRTLNLGAGLYGRSRFYGSSDAFSLNQTCNVWTATLLDAAGVPLGPERPLTAGALIDQLQRAGRRIAPPAGRARDLP